MLSFAEKLKAQRLIAEQNKLLAGNPSFTAKLAAQKLKLEAMAKLGMLGKPETIEPPKEIDNSNFGLQASGIKTREKINAQVKAITDQIRAGKDPATLTADEVALLKQYSGKGGLTVNSQHEYYTPTHVAEGVWDALKANGFENGNVLEPSTGAGVFLATKPAGVIATGTEIDETSATVAQVLNPKDQVSNQSFEKLAVSAPNNSFDAVIGNVPFGNARGPSAHDDPPYKNEKLIERYFVNRVIDKVKPGGLICLVVPGNIINAKGKAWEKFRIAISKKAEFLGAHKLPSKTFAKQGTDVVVDVLVMRKHGAEFLGKADNLAFDTLQSANVIWPEFIEGRYWQGEGKRFIQGEYVPKIAGDRYSREKVIAGDDFTDESIKRALAIKFDSRIDWDMLDEAEPIVRNYTEGDRKTINGIDHELKNGEWLPIAYTETKTALDSAIYGADSLEALQALMQSEAGILSLGFGHIESIVETFPNIVPASVKDALSFSRVQPDEHQWRAFRGAVIGAKIEAYTNGGSDDVNELAELKEIILHEIIQYGHPKDITGLVLAGKESKRLGMFVNSVDEAGNFSKLIEEGTVREETGSYNSKDPLSIVTYLFEQNQDPIELETVLSMYDGDGIIEDLGDIIQLKGLAVSPEGFIYPYDQYCSGDVYPKLRAMRDAMVTEKDKRIIEQYKKQIETIDAKRRKTPTEDITFRMRQKWFDNKTYALEFLHANGYGRTIGYDEERGEFRAHGVTGGIIPQIVNYLNDKPIMGGTKVSEYKDGIKALEDQFDSFMKAHANSEDLTGEYNEKFNGYVEFNYSNSDLGLKNLGSRIRPHDYQNEAIRRLSREGKGILGFDVGLGKTFSALALQAYNEQMGRSKRTCIVVPDAVLANWYHEHKAFYKDTSRMLIIGMSPKTDKNGNIQREKILDEHGKPKLVNNEEIYQDVLSKDDRETIWEKMHRVPQSNLSLVVMTHTQFGKIPVKNDTKKRYTDNMLSRELLSKGDVDKLMTSNPGKVSYADAQNNDRLKQKYADEGTAKQDAYPYFEDMGFDSVMVDEAHCFPAGTLVDGVPIEKINIGDFVNSFNHETGDIELKIVTDVMKRPVDRLVRVKFSNGESVVCTPDHPFFVPDVGYVGAEFLNKCYSVVFNYSRTEQHGNNIDLREMQSEFSANKISKEGGEIREQCILFENMPVGIAQKEDSDIQGLRGVRKEFRAESCSELEGGNGEIGHVLLREVVLDGMETQTQRSPAGRPKERGIDGEEAERLERSQLVANSTGRREESSNKNFERCPQGRQNKESRRERDGHDYSANNACQCAELGGRVCCDNACKEGAGRSDSLQTGFGESSVEYSDRGRREFSQIKKGKGNGYQENEFLGVIGVDSVEILEPGSDGRFGGLCPDGYVYDITVDGNHNFFAEGILVHNCFKNSFTPGKESTRIAYLPTPQPSQRAIDMSLKMSHIREINGGRGVVLLTATPVTNSPLEIYNMLSLLIPMEEFEAFGVYTPDDFVRVFGDIQHIEKMKVSGEVGNVDAMVGFQNLDGLRSLFHKYSIIKNADDVKLPLPDSDEVQATVELSDEQQAIYVELREEAKKASSPNQKDRESVRPLFSIIRDMDRTTTDLDMYHKQITFIFGDNHRDAVNKALSMMPKTVQRKEYDPDIERDITVTVPFEYELTEKDGKLVVVMTDAGEEDMVNAIQKVGIPEDEVAHPITPKYAELLKNLTTELEAGGKQIIFIEEKTQHHKLARIIVHFLPITLANIGIINATDAAGEKLQRISDDYNAGKIKIVIANKKAEVGVNLQKGTTAIHHLTFPWVPASMQQRNGRGVRQGNTVNKVNIYHYVGKGSFDLFRLNLINQKGNWINDILRGTESSMESKGDGHLSAEDVMVLLSDNPEEARARMEEAKAKREAAKKAKNDKAMVINLNQLIEARRKLTLLEGWKADEQAKIEDEIKKLDARIEFFDNDGSDESKAKLADMRRKRTNQATKLNALDAKYQLIEDNAKATIKQKTVFLKAKAASGELPFDASAIDNPDSVLITRDGRVIRSGVVFNVKTVSYGGTTLDGLFLVSAIDTKAQTVSLLQKGSRPDYARTIGLNDMYRYELKPVAMTLEEWNLVSTLSRELTLKEVMELGVDTVEKYKSEIKLKYGEFYLIDAGDGDVLMVKNTSSYETLDKKAFIWPELKSEAQKRSIAKEYFRSAPYGIETFMDLLFGAEWKTVIEQFLETTTQEDTLKQAKVNYDAFINEQSSDGDEFAFMSSIATSWGYYRLETVKKVAKGIGGDNKTQIDTWVGEFLDGRKAWFDEEKAKRQAEADKKALEALKNHPDYKEVPESITQRLAAKGITAKYNMESVYAKRNWPAFSLVLLQDANSKAGLLYAAKETLKSAFGAQFGADISRDFRGAWWYMSSSRDLEAIVSVILNDKEISISETNKEAPDKLKVPYGKVKVGDTVKGFEVKSLGKTWEAKDYEISVVKRDSGFDIEEGDLIQYARF
jgi:hypothetical protein